MNFATSEYSRTATVGKRAGSIARRFPSDVILLLAISVISLLLRQFRLWELPLDEAEPDPGSSNARTLAAALGAATPALLFALVRASNGRFVAFAAAGLVALSPWHLHQSRMGSLTSAVFLAAASACALAAYAPAPEVSGRRRILLLRLGGSLLCALLSLALADGFRHSGAARLSAPTDLVALLVAEVGPAVLALAALALFLGGAPARRAALAGALLSVAAWLTAAERTALMLAPIYVLAACMLGRALAACARVDQRWLLGLLALAPAIPSLASECIDGGRFELKSLKPELAARRHAGEPVFSNAPELAARAMGVECRALPAAPALLQPILPRERCAWLLILLDRGRPIGGPQRVPEDLEESLQTFSLVARSSQKRLDLHRYEARLYRQPEAKP